jgi:hypothetical protein
VLVAAIAPAKVQPVPLGGAFLLPENARRLPIFQLAETTLLRTLARWIPLAPEGEAPATLAAGRAARRAGE